MPSLIYETLDISEIQRIHPLWERLARHHREVSRYFAGAHRHVTFEERVEHLHVGGREHFRLGVARDLAIGENVGYCLCSLTRWGQGEVESVYVEPVYRGNGVGRLLVDAGLVWLREVGATSIIVGVAEGNDRALAFYRRLGFLPRTTLLALPRMVDSSDP